MPQGKISIVGIGRLGLCQALVFEAAGYEVLGCDVDASHVASINEKTLTSAEPDVERCLRASTRLRATLSLEECAHFSDLIMILVPTPNSTGEDAYDTRVLSKVLEDINAMRVRDKHIVIGCTVLPGYIDRVSSALTADCIVRRYRRSNAIKFRGMPHLSSPALLLHSPPPFWPGKPLLADHSIWITVRAPSQNCTISYNPEFVAQGMIMQGLRRPDMVLIGEGSTQAGHDTTVEFCFSHARALV